MLGFKVLEAVNDSGRLGQIILVAPKDVQDAFGIRIPNKINETGDLTKNIAMAIRELKSLGSTSSRVVIITTDLPYIEGKHIQAFLDACPDDADICVPPRFEGSILRSISQCFRNIFQAKGRPVDPRLHLFD